VRPGARSPVGGRSKQGGADAPRPTAIAPAQPSGGTSERRRGTAPPRRGCAIVNVACCRSHAIHRAPSRARHPPEVGHRLGRSLPDLVLQCRGAPAPLRDVAPRAPGNRGGGFDRDRAVTGSRPVGYVPPRRRHRRRAGTPRAPSRRASSDAREPLVERAARPQRRRRVGKGSELVPRPTRSRSFGALGMAVAAAHEPACHAGGRRARPARIGAAPRKRGSSRSPELLWVR
jgi:hypothetical protein